LGGGNAWSSPWSVDGIDDSGDGIDVTGGFQRYFDNGAITLEFWVKVSTDGPWNTVFDAEGGEQAQIRCRTATDAYIFIDNHGSIKIADGAWSALGWTHIAIANGGDNTLHVYKDGASVGDITSTTPQWGTIGTNSSLGVQGNGNSPIDGQIFDFRIWSTERTPTEILDNMNVILAGDESGLVDLWQMQEGTGTTVANQVSGANGGSFIGTGVGWTEATDF
jgi:hypothetical protein